MDLCKGIREFINIDREVERIKVIDYEGVLFQSNICHKYRHIASDCNLSFKRGLVKGKNRKTLKMDPQSEPGVNLMDGDVVPEEGQKLMADPFGHSQMDVGLRSQGSLAIGAHSAQATDGFPSLDRHFSRFPSSLPNIIMIEKYFLSLGKDWVLSSRGLGSNVMHTPSRVVSSQVLFHVPSLYLIPSSTKTSTFSCFGEKYIGEILYDMQFR